MEAIESKVKKLINYDFIQEEQHPDWVANIITIPRKMKRSKFASTFTI